MVFLGMLGVTICLILLVVNYFDVAMPIRILGSIFLPVVFLVGVFYFVNRIISTNTRYILREDGLYIENWDRTLLIPNEHMRYVNQEFIQYTGGVKGGWARFIQKPSWLINLGYYEINSKGKRVTKEYRLGPFDCPPVMYPILRERVS